MKKFFCLAASVFIFLFLCVIPARAADGQKCRAAGGECRGLTCLPDETPRPGFDCPRGGAVGGQNCCFPQDPNGNPIVNKKACGEPCSNMIECPEECSACQIPRGGGESICQIPYSGAYYDYCPKEEGEKKEACVVCHNNQGIWSALGCIPAGNTSELVGWLLGRGIALGGGIAFLLIIFASIKIITAAGDPEKLKGGKELLTAAISGLIFIIFSLFLLRLIGVDILHIPGFG